MYSPLTKAQRTRTSLIVLSLLTVALLTTASGQERFAKKIPSKELPNFGRVNERLYRGGQPRKGGIQQLASLGVNTIINLRDNDARALKEADETKAAGLRYFNVPLRRLGRPSHFQIDQVLSLINAEENGVVFVHCGHGWDRTGMVIAVYRISRDEWTDDEAKKEARHFGMKFWQLGMKDYISAYFRDRSQLSKPSKSTPRVRSGLRDGKQESVPLHLRLR